MNYFPLLFFLLIFTIGQSFALPSDSLPHTFALPSDTEEKIHLLEVRKNFPQYSRDFNEQAVQEEVYAEVLNELKEKESLNNKEGDEK